MIDDDRDERDHLADCARCGVCGNPNGIDCDHYDYICPVCGEYKIECICEDEEEP